MVVADADEDYPGAARLWWAFQYYGHRQVAVLDGGCDAWCAAGLPLSRKRPRVPPGHFLPRPQPGFQVSAVEVAAGLTDPASCLVDTRPWEQYAGLAVWSPHRSRFLPLGARHVRVGGVRLRPDRLPGAVHFPSSALLDPLSWRYLLPADLRAQAEAAGIRPDQRVIAYCGVGGSASLVLFALRRAVSPTS
ncbi:MAG: hypothetical protein KatS3mg061_2381 [Dehalococcoidia bacterium]|nr:MAG: hypothetical protein KatS3mg061_2381 [Dehalococcoidia bacterium]